MSLEQSAVEQICALAHAQATNTRLNLYEHGGVVLPKEYTLTELERFAEAPYRFRGLFSTRVLEEFIAYVNATGREHSGVFVDADNGKAKAVIDLGDDARPLWSEHRASLTLKQTPEYEALLRSMNTVFSQLDFIDFIEDRPECFHFVTDFNAENAASINIPAAIAAIRKLTINSQGQSTTEVGDFAASHSATDMIEIKAQGNPLPGGFEFSCPPYDGFAMKTFRCRIRALTDGKSPALKVRILGLNQAQEAIALEFRELLKAGVKQVNRFYCGDFIGKAQP